MIDMTDGLKIDMTDGLTIDMSNRLKIDMTDRLKIDMTDRLMNDLTDRKDTFSQFSGPVQADFLVFIFAFFQNLTAFGSRSLLREATGS
jgi:hypothetical protein